MKTEKMYSIAIRRRESPSDFFWNHEDFKFEELNIDCQNRYWLADPFLFEKGGKVYVFYEAFDLIDRKGKIGYSIVEENGRKMPIHIVLEEPYHLSFPNVFEHDGDVYLMPETCDNDTVKLFKATSFPDEWQEDRILLSETYACDSIIIQDSLDHQYLLANEMYRDQTPNGNYISCWVKNVCYPLSHQLDVVGDGVIVAEGDCGIRNAGKAFQHEGKLYRVGQNSPNRQYGKGLALFEVESLAPYQEHLLWMKDCDLFDRHIHKFEHDDIIGVHTYNFCQQYEIIDFSQIRKWKFATKFLKSKTEFPDRVRGFLVGHAKQIKRMLVH